MRVAAIVPAVGKGSRLRRATAKPYLRVSGKPLLIHTLQNLRRSFTFEEILLVVQRRRIPRTRRLLKRYALASVATVPGGATRAQSVYNGLKSLKGKSPWVLVHDVARPLVTPSLVRATLRCARRSGAAICALPVTSTVKRLNADASSVRRTEDRRKLILAQTPQVFRRELLRRRYRALGRRARRATDEAALFDGSRQRVGVARGEARNVKITTHDDLALFKFYLKTKGKGR